MHLDPVRIKRKASRRFWKVIARSSVSRHCEEPTNPAFGGPDDKLRDEAIQFVVFPGLLRFARNDGFILLGELQNQRVHRQRRAGSGVYLLDRAVALGAQYVLHL